MSFSEDGRFVTCDNPGCPATALAPVSSRTVQAAGSDSEIASAEDWLFVTTNDASLHFCPLCKENYLRSLNTESN